MQITDLLFKHEDPNLEIYVSPQGAYTVGQLQTVALERAIDFRYMEIKPGYRVILIADDSLEWLSTFWALLTLGCNVILLPHTMDCTMVHQLIKKHRIFAVCTDRSDLSNSLCRYYNIKNSPCHHAVLQLDFYQYDPQETVLCFLSSGTNGVHKLIEHTSQSLLGGSIGLKDYQHRLNVNLGDIICNGARMCSAFGWWFNVLGCLFLKTKSVVFVPVVDLAKNPSKILAHYQVNHVVTTPYMLSIMLKTLDEMPASVKSVLTAAEPLPKKLIDDLLHKHRISVVNLYGMSEMFAITIGDASQEKNTLGSATTDVQYRIVDEQGRVTLTGPGIAQIKHPAQFKSYLDDATSTQQVLREGWVHTNDMVQMGNDGNMTFVGRANSCLKIKGQWVSLLDVEECICNMRDVTDCVVVKSTDDQGMSSMTAFVSVDKKFSRDWSLEIKTHLRTVFHRNYMLPKSVVIVETIPRTSNFKKIRNIDTINAMLST